MGSCAGPNANGGHLYSADARALHELFDFRLHIVKI